MKYAFERGLDTPGFRRVHKGVAYRGKHFDLMFAGWQFHPEWGFGNSKGYPGFRALHFGRSMIVLAWWS